MNSADEDDPIVAEVRRAREEIAAMCGHDYKRIAEYVRQQDIEIRERMATSARDPTNDENAS
jgi:hypothetical protein